MFKQYENEVLNTLWLDEVEHKREYLLGKRQILEDILGNYYDELYDFFGDLISAEYDIKVLIARRCLVLFQLFLQIFAAENSNQQIYGKICSDRYVLGNYEELNGKSVLLVDDILIHGRKIYEVFQEIEKNMDKAAGGSVDIRVYMLTDSQKCVPDEIMDKIQFTDYATEWEWKTLSDGIVSTIFATNIPYTSFVGAYFTRNIQKLYRNSKNVQILKNTGKSQEKVGCETEVLFSSQRRLRLFEIFSHIECVRVYKGKCEDNSMVIPYIFTKALKSECLEELFAKMAELCGGMPNIKAELIEKSKGMIYRMRLFNALLSHIYGLYFFNNSYKPEIFEVDTLVKSFGERIATEFYKMTYEQIVPFLMNDYEGMKEYVFENLTEYSELEEIYRELASGCGGYREIYSKCIGKHRERDELRAQENKERLLGISVDYLFGLCRDEAMCRECAIVMLNSMDTGCAAASYTKALEDNAYASYISPGEQSFRLILEKYAEVIRRMIFLEEKKLDVEKYLEYMRGSLKWSDEEYIELQEFYTNYKGKLKHCNIVSILEDKRYWDIFDVKKYNQEYMKIILNS